VYAGSLDSFLTQELLGHAEPSTTAKYLAFSPIKASAAVTRLAVEAADKAHPWTVVCCSHCGIRPRRNHQMSLCQRCRRYQYDHDGALPSLPPIGPATAKVLAAADRLGRDASTRRLAEEAGVHINTVRRVLNGTRSSRERDARRLERVAALYITGDSDETPAMIASRMPERVRAEYVQLVERVSRKPTR
jgi:hypothetical protein